MGIPRFSSRMRSHGSVEVIGREGEQRNDRAIIDGPSLAHALLQQPDEVLVRSSNGLLPQYSYSAIGKAAIQWLDTLEQHGFTVEAIYFDGALPEHKKPTRADRLQAYVDKLVVFKAVQDDVAKSSLSSRNGSGPDRRRQNLGNAQRSLPPPPFLVFAVVEALLQSPYADRTFVVKGEADEFCAAKAMELPFDANHSCTSIFTNDSDLIVYGFHNGVRIVQINEMAIDDGESGGSLSSLEYWPCRLRELDGVSSMQDLVRPAYLMKQDPHMSFRNALSSTQNDASTFQTPEFSHFAASFDLTAPRMGLRTQQANTEARHLLLDSRISEFLHSVVNGRDRIRRTEAWHASEEQRVLEQQQADLSDGPTHTLADATEGGHPAADRGGRLVEGQDRINGVDFRDFAFDQKAEDLKPSDLDVFLPILFEDTSRATAWRAGAAIREVAIHVATALCGTSTVVLEHKRSGQRVREAPCQQISSEACAKRLQTWTEGWMAGLKTFAAPEVSLQWRLVALKALLADMAAEEMPPPPRDALRRLLTNAAAETWYAVHLHAQYQAEYYSLRMLKQVLSFVVRSTEPSSQASGVNHALRALETLPTVAAFCDPIKSEYDSEWAAAVGRFLDDCGLADRAPSKKAAKSKTDSSSDKRSGNAHKKRKTVPQTQNAFSSLMDAEEA